MKDTLISPHRLDEMAIAAMVAGAEEIRTVGVSQIRSFTPEAPDSYKDYSSNGGEVGPRGGRFDWEAPGRLRKSVKGSLKAEGNRVVVTFTAGDETTRKPSGRDPNFNYAVPQEKNLWFRHTNGGARYMERGVAAMRFRAANIMAKHFRRVLSGGAESALGQTRSI